MHDELFRRAGRVLDFRGFTSHVLSECVCVCVIAIYVIGVRHVWLMSAFPLNVVLWAHVITLLVYSCAREFCQMTSWREIEGYVRVCSFVFVSLVSKCLKRERERKGERKNSRFLCGETGERIGRYRFFYKGLWIDVCVCVCVLMSQAIARRWVL